MRRTVALLRVLAAGVGCVSGALLPAEQFLNMAEFKVRANNRQNFETLWADRKSLPMLAGGFKYFALLRREKLKPDGFPYKGGSNYVTCSIWDSKKAFIQYAVDYEKQLVGPGTLFHIARAIPLLGSLIRTPAEKLAGLKPKASKWDAVASPLWIPSDRTYGEGRAEVMYPQNQKTSLSDCRD